MRIIAGTCRGRRIEAPPGRGTRPMLARVREAAFATLTPWLAEARVLDLFAGSGGLGLEALSRGARHATFVEQDAGALRTLTANATRLGLLAGCEMRAGDALAPESWHGHGAWSSDGGFDIVFFDAPYGLLRDAGTRTRLLAALPVLASEALAPEGVIVSHVPRNALRAEDLDARLDAKVRSYGTSDLWYLQPAQPSDVEEEGQRA